LNTTVLLHSMQLCDEYIFITCIVNQASIVIEKGKLRKSPNKT